MKRLFQLRLRSFLVLVMLACLCVGWIAINHYDHQRESRTLESLGKRINLVANGIDGTGKKPPALVWS